VAYLKRIIDMTDFDAPERRAGTAMISGFGLVVATMARRRAVGPELR